MLTIDVKTLLLCVLIFAGIVLVVFLMVAVYNLIKTLKKSQKVLDDFEIVSKIANGCVAIHCGLVCEQSQTVAISGGSHTGTQSRCGLHTCVSG